MRQAWGCASAWGSLLGKTTSTCWPRLMTRLFRESITGAALRNLPHHQLVCLESTCTRNVNTMADAIMKSYCTLGLHVQSCHGFTSGRGRSLLNLVWSLTSDHPLMRLCLTRSHLLGKKRCCDQFAFGTLPCFMHPCIAPFVCFKNRKRLNGRSTVARNGRHGLKSQTI